MSRVRVVLILLMAVAVASRASAQRTTGEISGKVSDESGGVLPGVTVTIAGAGVAGTPTIVTSETGAYKFQLLPPGSYTLEYTLQGFTTLKRADVPVAVGSTIELDVKMTVGALTETLTVVGQAPVVNATSAEVSTTMNQEWVTNAPVKRFSYFDFANSAPGVSSNSNVGQSTTAQVLGSSTNENSYQIDGTEISSTPWLNTDAVGEVEVIQLGASAEYGNVQGAVFNIVTRQGSNDLHGDVNVYQQTQGLTSRNTTSAVDNGFPYHRADWRDATVQVSGPFVRDKLWFFGSFEYQRDYDSQPGVNPRYPAKNDSRRVFWKFNYNFTPNHRIMHGYHDDYYWIPETPSAFTAPSTIGLSHGDNPTPNVVYSGIFNTKTLVELRYSGFLLNSSNDPNLAGTPRVMARYVDDRTGQTTGGITNWAENRSYRNGYTAKLTRAADRFAGGAHDFNAGLQIGGHGSDSLNGPNDLITTTSTGTIRGTTQLPYHQGAKVRWIGSYFDDTYRLGRATINMGVRYDYSRAMFPSFPLLDANGNQTGGMSAANNDVATWSVFSPRVGATVKLNASATTVVKAHYGRYYKGMEANEFRPAVPSISPSYDFAVDPAGNRTNFVLVSSNANLLIDPNIKAPYTDQYIAQLEHELVKNLGVQVNYVYKRGDDYTGWADIGGTYAQVPYVDNVGADATGNTISVWKLTSPAASRVFLLTSPDGMFTRYKGVTMMATKRMSNNWQGVFSLVLSKSEGRLASSARATPTSTQTSTSGTFGREAAGPNDFVNTDGLLIGDRPVVAKAQFVYRFPLGVLVAANFQHQTGKPYARQVRVSGLGFPTAPTINVEPITGDRRVADLNLLDMRAQKEFSLPSAALRFAVFLDAMNVTNTDNYEGVASVLGTSSAFGVPTKYITPRRVQLGAKIRW